MADGARFAGHRLIEFSPAAKRTLREIAERLIPHEASILDGWVSRQFDMWEPPGFDRDSLGAVFSGILGTILRHLHSGELEACIEGLEQAGSDLAGRQFPFDALVISVHFFEESYIPLLLNPPPPNARQWLLTMDEFLHVALAAIANAYFEAYRAELLEQAEVGRIVQEGLLGHVPRKAIDLDIASAYIPAEEQAQLGGDFLDSFSVRDGQISFVMGDLSGHGVAAAADSVMLRSLFRGFMREQPDPALAMERLNRVIMSDLASGQFATALAFTYDEGGLLKLVNAGHPFPVLCGDSVGWIETNDIALAVDGNAAYHTAESRLEPGGLFVAYTDGLVEARGTARGMFGESRLLDTVSAMRDAPPRAVVDQLLDDARRFCGGKFPDDVAVLVLRRHLPR